MSTEPQIPDSFGWEDLFSSHLWTEYDLRVSDEEQVALCRE